jgi:kynureninase
VEKTMKDPVRSRDERLLEYRGEYPILSRSTYLINNSLGAMPRAAYDSLRQYASEWAEKGVVAWHEHWLQSVEEHAGLLGRAMGAPPASVMLHPNVSVALAVLASGLDFSGPRRQVVLSALEFHTVAYLWRAWQKFGAEIVVVPTEDGITIPTEKLIGAITEKTLIVPMSHVIFRSSYRQDAAAVAEAAHRRGAMVALDVYQSIGSMPLEAEKWKVDFAVGGSVKWICGGPGVGYLYVRPDLREKFRPAVTGWFSHQNPFAFDVERHDYSFSMWRYATGTPDIPAIYAARPGLNLVLEAGLENIRARSLRLTSRLIEGALARGWKVNTPLEPDWRGGHVTVETPEAERVSRELIRRRFIVDYRPPGPTQKGGIRLSPHFYNTEAEVDAVLEEMGKILQG